jgi:hypothetical protein
MRTATILLSKYSGKGRLRFYNNMMFEGTFTLQLYTGGFCTLKFTLSIQSQTSEFKLLNELVYADLKYRNIKRTNFEASFSGVCVGGPLLEISWMSLDNTRIDFTNTDVNIRRNPISGEMEVNPFDVVRNATLIEGNATLDFIVASEVHINYDLVLPEDNVSTFIGITNFIFHADIIKRPKKYHLKNSLIITLEGNDFEFVNVPHYTTFIEILNYDDFMKQLKSKQIDITCECISIQKFKGIPINRNKLYKILYILSFATCNWLATLYENTYKDMKLVRTVLLPHRTFPFLGGQYAINPTSTNNSLKRLVEVGYEMYSSLESQLRLKFLIEDYIMSPREDNLEARYLLLAIAMETIASFATSFAERNNTVIRNSTKLEKSAEILKASKKANIVLSDQLVEEIQKFGGFNDVRLRDKLTYIFDELKLAYDKKELSNLVKYRNIMVHAGISRDTTRLRKEWHNLANLFDRLMLTLLCWKGNIYMDKSKDYLEQILE